MPSLGELTRQYQAALEERRHTRDNVFLNWTDDWLSTEDRDALDHIEAEVERTRDAMEAAWLERLYA